MPEQPTGSVSALSLLEDFGRRFKLRIGQKNAARYIVDNPQQNSYAIELPTAYGKTIVNAMIYALLRAQGRADRLLIIVPTTLQSTQYVEDFHEDLAKLDITARAIRRCSGESNVIKAHLRNEAEIFITTVQQIHHKADYFSDLMERGNWAVCCDEYHRYRDAGKWGAAIKILPHAAIYGMSGTPERTDSANTLFGAPDVKVTLREARREGAIRGLRVHVEKYKLDVTVDGELKQFTTDNLPAQMAEQGVSSMSEFELKCAIRYHSKYVNSMLELAGDKLSEKQLTGLRHQMLVFAMTVAHAKSVADILQKLVGDTQKVGWCGTGPNGLNDKDNAAIIKSFKKGEIDILVQVRLATEGFNSVYASVGVYLNMLNGRSVEADQTAGRELRRHPGIPDPKDDIAHIFVSEDTCLAEYLSSLEELISGDDGTLPGMDGTEVKDRDPDAVQWVNIPVFFLLDMDHTGEDIFHPLDETERRTYDNATEDVMAAHPGTPEETARKAVAAQMLRYRPQRTDEDMLKEARGTLSKAVNILAGNIVRRIYGRRFPQSTKGDTIRQVNSQIKRRFGAREGMLMDDVSGAYKWVKSENDNYSGGADVPEWGEL